MLPDHAASAIVGVRVVGVIRPGCHQYVSDARQHLGIDLTEPSCGDRLITSRNPRATPLGRTPELRHLIGCGIRFEMQLEAPRFPRDVPHPRELFRSGDPLRVLGHVDHPVIGRDEQAVVRPEKTHDLRDLGIDVLQGRDPLGRCETLGVAGHVEIGNVVVDERLPRRGEHVTQSGAPGCRIGGAEELRPAQHRVGELRVLVPAVGDRHRPNTGRPLEEGRHPLPCRGVETVPAAQLVDDTIVIAVVHPVPHQTVASTRFTGRERRERSRGRRREAGADRGVETQSAGERASVAGTLREGGAPQPVDDHHHRLLGGREAQPAAATREGIEAIRQDIGKAQPVRFRRR